MIKKEKPPRKPKEPEDYRADGATAERDFMLSKLQRTLRTIENSARIELAADVLERLIFELMQRQARFDGKALDLKRLA